MNRSLTYTIAAALVALGIIAAMTYRRSDSPTEKRAPVAPELVIPAAVPTPAPVPASPTAENPTSLPPAIAKIEARMRMTQVNRPMNEVGKNWFGCASESSYNDTLALLNQKSPAVADRFKGAQAECSALKAGWHVTVLHLDTANNVAQISVDETHNLLWTDSLALKGREAPK